MCCPWYSMPLLKSPSDSNAYPRFVHAGGAGPSNLTRLTHDLGARLEAVAVCRRPRGQAALKRRTATAYAGFPGAQAQRSCAFAPGNPGLDPQLYPHFPFGLVARVAATHKRDKTVAGPPQSPTRSFEGSGSRRMNKRRRKEAFSSPCSVIQGQAIEWGYGARCSWLGQ